MKLWKSKKNNTTTNSGPSINCVSGKQSHLNQNNDNKADTATNSSTTTISGKLFISFSVYWALFVYSFDESVCVVGSTKLTVVTISCLIFIVLSESFSSSMPLLGPRIPANLPNFNFFYLFKTRACNLNSATVFVHANELLESSKVGWLFDRIKKYKFHAN